VIVSALPGDLGHVPISLQREHNDGAVGFSMVWRRFLGVLGTRIDDFRLLAHITGVRQPAFALEISGGSAHTATTYLTVADGSSGVFSRMIANVWHNGPDSVRDVCFLGTTTMAVAGT